MAYPRYRRARAHRKVTRTSGNFSLNNANWTNLDTGLDIPLEAQVGDDVEVGLSALAGNQAFDLYLDVVSLVAGAPVNSFGSGGAVTTAPPAYGISGWYAWAGYPVPLGAAHLYTVQAGDLASGVLTMRLRFATGAGARTLYASTNNPFQFHATILGPADPE